MLYCKCRDLGMDCEFEITGTTENDIIKKFIKHSESVHHIPVLTADAIFKLEKSIKNRGRKQR